MVPWRALSDPAQPAPLPSPTALRSLGAARAPGRRGKAQVLLLGSTTQMLWGPEQIA